MKSILMSIQPKWVEKIISGQKTIKESKTAPKEVQFWDFNSKNENGEVII